jgi:acyl carrier protein
MDREVLRQMLREKLEFARDEPITSMDDNVNLRTDLGLDSIDMVSLIIDMQTEYGIMMESEELEPIVKVGQLLDVLVVKLAHVKREAA